MTEQSARNICTKYYRYQCANGHVFMTFTSAQETELLKALWFLNKQVIEQFWSNDTQSNVYIVSIQIIGEKHND